MNEPTLNQIEDYHTLKGEKRRTVMAVILACLIMGGIYTGIKLYFGTVSDQIPGTENTKGYIPTH